MPNRLSAAFSPMGVGTARPAAAAGPQLQPTRDGSKESARRSDCRPDALAAVVHAALWADLEAEIAAARHAAAGRSTSAPRPVGSSARLEGLADWIIGAQQRLGSFVRSIAIGAIPSLTGCDWMSAAVTLSQRPIPAHHSPALPPPPPPALLCRPVALAGACCDCRRPQLSRACTSEHNSCSAADASNIHRDRTRRCERSPS